MQADTAGQAVKSAKKSHSYRERRSHRHRAPGAAVASLVPSGENATTGSLPVISLGRSRRSIVAVSQMITDWSADPVTIKRPFRENSIGAVGRMVRQLTRATASWFVTVSHAWNTCPVPLAPRLA